MKFSTKTRYGIRAMLEIAEHTDVGIYQKDIAENQGISNKYLDHIIHNLKAAGLIVNLKGKKSGYVLTRKASEISIYDIHNAFESGICVIDCMSRDVHCSREKYCSVRGFWSNLNKQVIEYFKSVTLLDLLKKEKQLEG